MNNEKNKSKRATNISKRFGIVEHLVNKPVCASKSNLKTFKTVKNYYSNFDLI